MRLRSLVPSALALVLLAGLAVAQSPEVSSKLAGRWSLVVENADSSAPPPPVPATASSGWGREITITVEAERVTIERHQFAELDVQPPVRFVYELGGAESRNVVDMGLGPQEQVARAEWRGETLLIASRHAAGTDLAAEVTQSFSLDAEGALLVETTRTSSGATSTTRSSYRRLPPPTPTSPAGRSRG